MTMTEDESLLHEMWCAYTLHATPKPFSVREGMASVLAIVRAHDRDGERYRVARRKVCIVGDSFHVINLRPTYVAPDAAIEFDAAIDAAIARGKE